jgi:predicted nucleotidyltransferase
MYREYASWLASFIPDIIGLILSKPKEFCYNPSMDIQRAADRLRRKYKAEEEDLAKRREQACKRAFEIASILAVKDPDLKQVFGFGSVFERWRKFRNDSDIDLAIVGGDWSRLMRTLPESDFSVDLVELELQNPEFIKHVREKGVLLYDKKC